MTSRTTGRELSKPTIVHDYNQCMNAVDRADQCYAFVRRCKKWWRKVYFWLLEVTVVNSYVLFKSCNTQHNITHLEYRRQVIDALAARHILSAPPRRIPGRPRKRPRESCMGDHERLNGQTHLLGKGDSHSCAVCSNTKEGRRHRSVYYCKTCTAILRREEDIA